jgi:phage anti-repressor protein
VYNIHIIQAKELKMPFRDEPHSKTFYKIISSEEFYEENYDFGGSYDAVDFNSDECPDWVQEEIDEEIPF